ncbi:MAG: Fic family protein [Deltaproteobacteria bacterium]|nr:Fic family protein [Deltaproteobacteria bacterium]
MRRSRQTVQIGYNRVFRLDGGIMDHRLDNRLAGVSPPAWPGILARISEIDEFKGWWRGRHSPPPSYLGGLRKKSVALSAAASLGVGWTGLPRPVGDTASGLPPALSERLRRASAARYAHLVNAVFDGPGKIPLSRETILGFHAELMRYAPGDPALRGAWRSLHDRSEYLPRHTAESIALRPAAPESIPSAMDALLRWTTTRLDSGGAHPLLVTACFLLVFLAIRPFASGNGRTSRLLTQLLLLRGGYGYLPYASLDKVIAERKVEYYLALRKSQSSLHLPRPDMGPWFLAFLEALRLQARELRQALAPLPAESRLSGKQEGALALFGRHREITNRLVSAELGIPRETAKQVLNRLVALHLVSRAGAGRAVRYRKAEPA